MDIHHWLLWWDESFIFNIIDNMIFSKFDSEQHRDDMKNQPGQDDVSWI